jgi:hypothetical protein
VLRLIRRTTRRQRVALAQLIYTYTILLALMLGHGNHGAMLIPTTYIAVHLTRRLVEQGGPKPRFVRRRRP